MTELIKTTPVELVPARYCGNCGALRGVMERFCTSCGTRHDQPSDNQPVIVASALAERSQTPNHQLATSNTGAATLGEVLNNRPLVIGMLVLIGPIALPALWFSSSFSKPTKFSLTTLYVLLSAVVPLAIAWYWMDYSLRPLLEVIGR